MRHSFILVFLFVLAIVSDSHSQITSPKYANEFLSIGVGARALGMSNSYVTSTNDVTSGYWNPAGLMGIESDLQLAGMHAEYFAGIAAYDYGAVGKRIDSTMAASISLIRFGVDDIPNTTDLIDANGNFDYDRISSFSAADYAFILSLAKKTKIPGLNAGVNAKIVYRKVGDFADAYGIGIDLGFQYKKGNWDFALMARDITTTITAWNVNLDDKTKETFELTGNEIPSNSTEATLPKLILGGARTFEFNKVSLLTELNVDVTTDGKRNVLISGKPFSIDPHLGIEAGYDNTIFLRAGIGNIQKYTNSLDEVETTFQPNIGVGLRIKRLYIDYALTDIGDQSVALVSNIFSLKLDIVKG